MDTDSLDRDAYREWWEAEGRCDESVCPCGQPAEDIMIPDSLGRLEAPLPRRDGFCGRHGLFREDVTRETFAGWIIDGRFAETDLTDDELRKASLVAAGFIGDKLN